MGWCRDFGSQIAEGCDHPMQADSDSCHCERCGVVCTGRFEACPAVWAQGPQPVVITLTSADALLDGPRFESQITNGHQTLESGATNPPSTATPAAPANAPPETTAPAGATGAEVLRSYESAFDELRLEVKGLRSFQEAFDSLRLEVEHLRSFQDDSDALRVAVDGLRRASTHEASLVASLVENSAESRLDEAALGKLVTSAVQVAARREAADLETALAASVDAMRDDMEAMRQAHEDGLASLRVSIEATSAALPADLSRRDSGNRKALRTTLHEEFQPLVEVVAESVAQSEYQLQALDRRLDKLEELGRSLAAGLATVSASLEVLLGEELQPDDDLTPVRPRPPRQAAGARAASGFVSRATGSSTTPALSRRQRNDTPAGPGERVAGGRRVSMRGPTDDG